MKRSGSAAAIAGLLLGVGGAPRVAGAQDGVAGIPAGARVRLTLPDSLRVAPLAPRATALVGHLVRTSGDTLFVLPPGAVVPTAVRLTAVRGVEQSRGASRLRSALQQGVIGGLTWGLLTYAIQRGDGNRARNALAWGAGGLSFGGALGSIRPYEQWRRVQPPSAQ